MMFLEGPQFLHVGSLLSIRSEKPITIVVNSTPLRAGHENELELFWVFLDSLTGKLIGYDGEGE